MDMENGEGERYIYIYIAPGRYILHLREGERGMDTMTEVGMDSPVTELSMESSVKIQAWFSASITQCSSQAWFSASITKCSSWS